MIICNIYDKAADVSDASSCVIALGNFDGVHVGHTALLSKTVELAKKLAITPAVFTFSKHPETVLGSRSALTITTLAEKLELFESIGIERVFLAKFEDIRDFTPMRFVDEVLKSRIGAVMAVCGYDFKFGIRGSGTPEDLVAFMNGDAVVIDPVMRRDQAVSSTLIRAAVEEGDMEYASEMLNRPFFIEFPVVHGKAFGRTIGIPTINQNFPGGHVIPKRGVYACKVLTDSGEYMGVANIGLRPTVKDDKGINCETHIIGFSGWLYEKTIRVSFYKRLRDEVKFNSTEELKFQIKKDIEDTKNYFNRV